jgi:RND family efflux transporter MFP subunit
LIHLNRTSMHFLRAQAAPLVLTALLLLCIAASSCKSGDARPSAQLPPPIVQVVKGQQKTVPIYQEYLGQTAAVNPVEIHSQVTGLLQAITFREGSIVNKGQLLFTIDPRLYVAALNQARANRAQAAAALANDRKNLKRDQILFNENVLARAQLDTQSAQTAEAVANVEAAQAAVASAALNLSYTRIYAPIEGRIGIAQIKVGALVQQNTTLLDTIYSISPTYVDFSVTELAYINYQQAAMKEDAAPGLELILPNSSIYPYKGTVIMANPTVDPNTGTLGLRAEFPNPEGLLRPGLFVRVRAMVSEKANAVLIPERAVGQVQGQRSVYVVGAGNKVEFRSVKLGPTVDHWQVVDSGVQAGDRVIVEGQQNVRPGMTVVPVLQSKSDHVVESQSAINGRANGQP